jgi:hypothetical protein
VCVLLLQDLRLGIDVCTLFNQGLVEILNVSALGNFLNTSTIENTFQKASLRLAQVPLSTRVQELLVERPLGSSSAQT